MCQTNWRVGHAFELGGAPGEVTLLGFGLIFVDPEENSEKY